MLKLRFKKTMFIFKLPAIQAHVQASWYTEIVGINYRRIAGWKARVGCIATS